MVFAALQSVKKAVLAALFLQASLALFASTAHAEVFSCQSVDQDTRIEVYFDAPIANDDRGPRARAVVASDPTVSPRRSLIARFDAVDGLVNNSGSVVVAYVDLNNPKSSHKGERIGGTRLGSLRSILIDIDHSYQEAVVDGARLSASVVYTKTTGEELQQDFDCIRYISEASLTLHMEDQK
jgi:hypothetical protein